MYLHIQYIVCCKSPRWDQAVKSQTGKRTKNPLARFVGPRLLEMFFLLGLPAGRHHSEWLVLKDELVNPTKSLIWLNSASRSILAYSCSRFLGGVKSHT